MKTEFETYPLWLERIDREYSGYYVALCNKLNDHIAKIIGKLPDQHPSQGFYMDYVAELQLGKDPEKAILTAMERNYNVSILSFYLLPNHTDLLMTVKQMAILFRKIEFAVNSQDVFSHLNHLPIFYCN